MIKILHPPFARTTKQETGDGFLDVHAAIDRGCHTLCYCLIDVGRGGKTSEFLFFAGRNGSLGCATCTFCVDLDPNHPEIRLSDANVDPLTRIFLEREAKGKNEISPKGIKLVQHIISPVLQKKLTISPHPATHKDPNIIIQTSDLCFFTCSNMPSCEKIHCKPFFSVHTAFYSMSRYHFLQILSKKHVIL